MEGINLSTQWSTGSCKHVRSLDEIRSGLTRELSMLGFGAFSYEGVPFRFKSDLVAPTSVRLFKYQHIASGVTAIASDDREMKRLKAYLGQYASSDPVFKRYISFERPYIRCTKNHWRSEGYNSTLIWPMREYCPPEWGGLFSLKSCLSANELEDRLKTYRPQIHHVLLMYHLELMSGYRRHFNPYRNLGVFSDNALTILNEMAMGQSSKNIGKQLDISERGVDYHIDQMRRKLQAVNRLHLVNIANKLELI